MKLWKVRVRGEYFVQAPDEILTSDAIFLLEAKNIDAAMEAAKEWGECKATFGRKWVSFSVMEAASVELPMTLEEFD